MLPLFFFPKMNCKNAIITFIDDNDDWDLCLFYVSIILAGRYTYGLCPIKTVFS